MTGILLILVSVAYLVKSEALKDSMHATSLLGIPVTKEIWEITGSLFYCQSYRRLERLIQNLISTELEAKDMIANSQPGFMERKPCQRNRLSLMRWWYYWFKSCHYIESSGLIWGSVKMSLCWVLKCSYGQRRSNNKTVSSRVHSFILPLLHCISQCESGSVWRSGKYKNFS